MLIKWCNGNYREYYNGTDHCYKLHHIGLTWQDARNTCADGLLYVENGSELDFLRRVIFAPQAERGVVWLAGRKETTGSFANIKIYKYTN